MTGPFLSFDPEDVMRMSHRLSARQPLRTMIIAVSGGAIIALGAASAVAGPASPDFPLGSHSQMPEKPEKPEEAQKAEELGGELATGIIEMGTGLVKCGLNIIEPTVKCE